MTRLAPWTAEFAILVAVGAVFGWIGPFDTFSRLGAVDRFAYWLIAIPLVGLPASLAIRQVSASERGSSWPMPLQALVGALIAGLPSTFIIVALNGIFRLETTVSLASVAYLYGSVTLLIAAMGIPARLIYALYLAPTAARAADLPPAPTGVEGSPFLRRIPAKLGPNLLFLEMEDHYLRVHTDLGSDLILFRLSDALAEIDSELGRQVHRSYWVARRAVASIERRGHRTSLVLSNGARVPVSRTYLPALRRAGWL